MVNTENKDSRTRASPRLCLLTREQGQSYGFHVFMLMDDPGHLISDVKIGSIAERSGLKNGDMILEVNCCFVPDLSHEEVIFKMNVGGNKLSLLVLSKEEYDQNKSNLRSLIDRSESIKPPRLFYIMKDPVSGLGISFAAVAGQHGRFDVSVVPGGAAEKAGVRQGDRLVWMNGVPAEDLTKTVIRWMLKKCSTQITVLVIDAESEEYYTSQEIPILPAMATQHNLPYKSRRLHLVRGEEGYGFILRFEPLLSGRNAHILREIDERSPAERAGMRNEDRLLEVNGESVEPLSHCEIVERIVQNEGELILTVISEGGLDYYTALGVSPLLFCEDILVEEQEDNVSENSLPAILIHEEKKSSIKARFCCVERKSVGLGFFLVSSEENSGSGIIISQVEDGGPAQEAGLQNGDEVLEINGYNVEGKTLEEVKQLLEEGGSMVSVQVIQKIDQDQPAAEAEEEEEITQL